MEIQQYLKKDMLGWLSYEKDFTDTHNGRVNRAGYVYPRYILENGVYEPVSKSDFPTDGSVVAILSDTTAEELEKRASRLIYIRFNVNGRQDTERPRQYSFLYNFKKGRNESYIWIDKFDTRSYFQIIDVTEDMEAIQRSREIRGLRYKLFATQVLLHVNDKLIGPFDAQQNDTQENENSIFLNSQSRNDYYIGQYDFSDYQADCLTIRDDMDDRAVCLIHQSKIAPLNTVMSFDWISDDKLIEAFSQMLLRSGESSQNTVKELKNAVKANDDLKFTQARRERIRDLLEQKLLEGELVEEVIRFTWDTPTVKTAVLKNSFDFIKADIPEYTDLVAELNELRNYKKQGEQQPFPQPETDSTAAPAEVEKELQDLKEENERLQEENQNLRDNSDLKNERDGLEKEIKKQRKEIEKLKDDYKKRIEDNKELEDKFNATLDDFSDKAKQTARILDSKLLERILRGLGEEPASTETEAFHKELLAPSMSRGDIIQQISDFVEKKAHRSVPKNDLINYLICISQGFITTFAGNPGTGKTSLCNILAKSFGLATESEKTKRFVDVSVERGWTSYKDFIGYYNPLTKRIEESNHDVYEAFRRMNDECVKAKDSYDPAEIAPFFILLDEANLSPMEHYWAAFLKSCDSVSASDRAIPLGGNTVWHFPEYLRFLATVNFDHTTEELSPRFLDRSWIITLEPELDDINAASLEDEPENSDQMISFGDLRNAFFPSEDEKPSDTIQDKWNKLLSIFKDHSLSIAPRSQKMIYRFCAVACHCMDCDTPTTRLAPLDYAFSQKVLPTVNGAGTAYKDLINALLEETKIGMPLSKKHLERMRWMGEETEFYQFFAK